MFPENVVQATFQRVQTFHVLRRPKSKHVLEPAPSNVSTAVKKQIQNVDGMNILGTSNKLASAKSQMTTLGIIVFCTGFGIVISQLGDRARIIVDFFVILEAVIMRLVETLMWYVDTTMRTHYQSLQAGSTWHRLSHSW